jgi:hypothetical protein
VVFNNRNETQYKDELGTSKGKQIVTNVLVIYSCSNFPTNNPSIVMALI